MPKMKNVFGNPKNKYIPAYDEVSTKLYGLSRLTTCRFK